MPIPELLAGLPAALSQLGSIIPAATGAVAAGTVDGLEWLGAGTATNLGGSLDAMEASITANRKKLADDADAAQRASAFAKNPATAALGAFPGMDALNGDGLRRKFSFRK